jgi:hypothetical protein
MVYIGWNYSSLVGKECSCFPWIKRAVGPGFFVGDAVMLVLAALAGLWSGPARGLKPAALILTAIAVFVGASYGITMAQQGGVAAPPSVAVDGKPYDLTGGRVFLYFFDPQCMHCFEAAKRMKEYKWKDVRVLTIPTREAQFAPQFLRDTGLQAPLTGEVDALRTKFQFQDPPYGVLLENGRQREAFLYFDEAQPHTRLKELAAIE